MLTMNTFSDLNCTVHFWDETDCMGNESEAAGPLPPGEQSDCIVPDFDDIVVQPKAKSAQVTCDTES